MSGFVKVRYLIPHKGKKIGTIGQKTTEKANEMIEKKIVEKYDGPMVRNLRREHKLKINLNNLR